jgi:uncharacterized protein (TIGR02453 family)
MTTFFEPSLFAFLRDLAENNDRGWFAANKERYRQDVQEPMLAFISAFSRPLAELAPAFIADPRPSGGSMFRIYRDTRFARDKRPYKTHAAAQFRHRRGRDVHAPGFYVHLAPDEVFMGAGIWHPDGGGLKNIRLAIVEDPDRWSSIVSSPTFSKTLKLSGDSLLRPPRGFDRDHPLVDDLKRKDFIATRSLDEGAACAPTFLDEFSASCRAALPLVRFLTDALELEWK